MLVVRTTSARRVLLDTVANHPFLLFPWRIRSVLQLTARRHAAATLARARSSGPERLSLTTNNPFSRLPPRFAARALWIYASATTGKPPSSPLAHACPPISSLHPALRVDCWKAVLVSDWPLSCYGTPRSAGAVAGCCRCSSELFFSTGLGRVHGCACVMQPRVISN